MVVQQVLTGNRELGVCPPPPRQPKVQFGIPGNPFTGRDLWKPFELSQLAKHGVELHLRRQVEKGPDAELVPRRGPVEKPPAIQVLSVRIEMQVEGR